MAEPTVNPYADVDFDTAVRYAGVTHMHSHEGSEVPNQQSFDYSYGFGSRVMAWANYYPEEPTPSSEFSSIPADVILVDNSEQHSCTDKGLHFCPLGSTYSNDGGTGVPWRSAFDAALALLKDPDGGGITLNHPMLPSGGLDVATIGAMLDHDPRVLGIEVYNHMVLNLYPGTGSIPAFPRWDAVLTTGRRCWGFFAHDHYLPEYFPYMGFNMLLLNEAPSEASACRAYRDGRFYGSLTQTMALTGFEVTGRNVAISTDNADTIRMITDVGTVDQSGPATTFTVPALARYARFEGLSDDDTVYTQPLSYADDVAAFTKRRARRFILGID